MLALSGAARAAALSIEVAGISTRANSAIVAWEANDAVRAVVEYGTMGEYGLWTSQSAPATTGGLLLSGLEPRTQYQFHLIGIGADGTRAETTGSVTTPGIGPSSGATTTADALLVNGQPLFPRMVFHTCSWYYGSAVAAGINLFMGSACTQGAQQLALLRGTAFSLLATREQRTNGRGLIGWYQQDEPDGHGRTSLPTLPASAKSGRVSFLTLTDHFSSRSAPLAIGRAIYPRLIAKAEMIGFDSYPLQTRCKADFTLTFDLQRELVALARGRPTYQWIESGHMGKCGRSFDPTPATIRAEVWLAIAGGARGIGYFPDFWPPEVASAIKTTNATITALARALLAPEAPVSFGPAGTPVKAGARLLNGSYYIVAVNPGYRSATATFTVPGLAASSVRVFGEGRTVPVRNGRFTDAFAGLGVHIYIAAPQGL